MGILCIAAACATDAVEEDITVRALAADVITKSGPVRGELAGDLAIFRGLPYAAPPTGARRFAPPAAPAPWQTPRLATAFGPACPQAQPVAQSEDCLSLNVWAHRSGAARPVIVWIHGGGFIEGRGSDPQYDGAALARNGDVVVVTINYRLGLLGFLSLPQVAAPDGGTGNWGLRDQIAALRWVHDNIAAFGGDPSHVMIAGESAGGASVCMLLAARGTQGLFSSAAIESGPCRVVAERDRAVGQMPPAFGVGVLTALDLGCASGDVAGCLRSRPASAILATQGRLPTTTAFGFATTTVLPVVDGAVLDQQPLAAIRGGRGNVSLLAGANRDDASAFIAIGNEAGAFARYLVSVGRGNHLLELLALYPPAQLGERGAAIAFATDLAFACAAEAVTQIRPATSRLYQLDRPASGPLAPLGAVHGLDYLYLFGTFSTWGIDPAPEQALSIGMQQLWATVARGQPQVWPARPWILQLDTTSTLALTWRNNRCGALLSLES